MPQTASAPKLDLERILGGGQLPALPQSAIRLLQLSNDPNNGPAEFAVPIECDPGLTGQVLRFVNSSYFGFSREISSVKLAITLVGVRTIKNFALWSAVFSLMPNPKCGPFDLQSLWKDSLRRAIFARATAKLLGLREAEEPFAGALLQDMAVPLLAKEFPADYVILLGERTTSSARLSDLERERFGWTHAEVAGKMARRWNLPEAFAVLVEQHTQVEDLLAQATTKPAHVAVALSSLLPAGADHAWFEAQLFETYYNQIRTPRFPSLLEILAEVDRDFIQLAPVLRVAVPSKTLIDLFRESGSMQ